MLLFAQRIDGYLVGGQRPRVYDDADKQHRANNQPGTRQPRAAGRSLSGEGQDGPRHPPDCRDSSTSSVIKYAGCEPADAAPGEGQ